MNKLRFNFLNYAPDLDHFQNPGLDQASNVFHRPEGYKPAKGINTASPIATMPGESIYISLVGLGNDDDSWICARHASTANRVEVGSFGVTITSSSGHVATAPAGASAGALQSFSASELGSEIVATAKYYFKNASNEPISTAVASGYIDYTITSIYDFELDEILYSYEGFVWTDLPNSAKGAVSGVVNDFVMIGNEGDQSDDSGHCKVRWCAIGDATDWPIPNTDDARSKQSGQQQLNPEYGQVTGIAGNDFFAYIFQERAITKATYVGGDVVFSFDTFEEARGCGYPQRFVAVDDTVFFESKSNRHALLDGQVTDIGYGKVDDAFPPTGSFFALKRNTELHTIFFSNGLAYNYKTDQWTYMPTVANGEAGYKAVASTNNADRAIIQADTTNVPPGTGQTRLYTCDGGTVLDAYIQTGSIDLNKFGRSIINGVRPLIAEDNASTVTAKVGATDSLASPDNAVIFTTGVSLNSRTNMANFREEGRYHRIAVNVSGGFETIKGADIDWSPAGKV